MLQDGGGFESGWVTDALASVDAGLDSTTVVAADAGNESGPIVEAGAGNASAPIVEAGAGNVQASSLDSSGEAGADATIGEDGSVGDNGNDVGADTGADPGVPTSCAPGGPGKTNCGAASESCCTSLAVTGATYYRTYTNYGTGATEEADPATVSAFRLDKYLVTVGRFRQFVSAWQGGWTPSAGSGKHTHLNGGLGLVNVGDDAGLTYEPGWVSSDFDNIAPTDANLVSCSGGTASAGNNENLPIGCENWFEAYAFCIWDGGFLPSESEWEYAAAGGNEQREYPWGAADPGTSNQYAIYACYYSVDSPNASPCPGNIAPVGAAALGAGRWGQLDLVGNVPQWCADSSAPYVNPCSDCGDFTVTSLKVHRGGAFGEGPQVLLPSLRLPYGPATRDYYNGFRCARTP
jgi:formylglycine-generating enzyme